MPTIKTAKQIVSDLRNYMSSVWRHLNTSTGSLTNDLVLQPMSAGGELIMTELQKVADLQVLDRVEGDDLDLEGANERAERLPGRAATGKLVFWVDSSQPPQTDLTVKAGTAVMSRLAVDGQIVTVETTEERTMLVEQLVAHLSPTRGRYELEVPAVATVAGTVGNQPAGSYTVPSSPITGFTGVENLEAFDGGMDAEEDDAYRERIRLRKIGRDRGVVSGLKRFVLDEFNRRPLEVEIVTVNDSDSERPDGTDIWVIDSDPVSTWTDRFIIQTGITKYVLSKQPIIRPESGAIATVIGEGGGPASVPPSGDHTETGDNPEYQIVINDSEGHAYRFSTNAGSYFQILDPAAFEYDSASGVGEVVAVTYPYSKLIVDIQSLLDDDNNRFLAANVLAKRAIRVDIHIKAKVTFFANVDRVAEREKITNALSQFFADSGLGVSVDHSDLIVVIQTGYGDYPISSVDAVTIRKDENGFYGQSEVISEATYAPDADGRITIDRKHYARLGTVTFL